MPTPTTPTDSKPLLSISRHQYGLLRDIAAGRMTLERAQKCKDHTLHSILNRKWAVRRGDYLLLTESGLEAYNTYHRATMPQRIHDAELTERSARLLRLVKVIRMDKAREQAKEQASAQASAQASVKVS